MIEWGCARRFSATMANHDEVGIGDAVLLDKITVDSFVDNLEIRLVFIN